MTIPSFDPTRFSDEERAQRRAALAQKFAASDLETVEAPKPKLPTRPYRANKRMVYGYLEPDAFRDLKVLVAKNDMTTDAAMSKAVALLFKSYGEKVPPSITKRLKTLGL